MQEEIQNENTDIRTEPVIGKFKPKRKFLNFVSAANGARIRFIRDIAFIKGEKLSGVLEGVIFKVTICDEGTINFEEQKGSNLTDESMIKRLIADIDEKDVTGYAQKFVVASLEFNDINGDRCYLEVEHEKPINKLKSLFEEEESKSEISDKGLSILDSLFGDTDDSDEVEEPIIETEKDAEVFFDVVENPSEPNDKLKNAATSYMEEQFRKMNESKIMELEHRIEETQKEIIRLSNEASQAEKKKEEKTESLRVLETRLETMKPGDEPNGYVFFVSEEQKDMESLDESELKVATKIADIMKLKTDVLVKMLTDGYYKIKIAKKDDITNQDFELEKEVYQKIMTLDVNGKMKMTDEGFEYRGKLNWHQLVSKMIRNGFEQDEEFDKLCNSNSYESKWNGGESDEDEDDDMSDYKNSISDMAKNLGMGNVTFGEDGIEVSGEEEEEFYAENLTTFDEETDLVFIGTESDGYLIMITDDYSGMGVYINGELVDGFECDGRFTAMTLSDYKKWYEKAVKNNDIEDSGIEGFVVPNFKGEIQIGARIPYPVEYARNIDQDDYIQHQFEDSETFVNLPEGTTIYKLNDDLSLPINVIRDTKIDNVLK